MFAAARGGHAHAHARRAAAGAPVVTARGNQWRAKNGKLGLLCKKTRARALRFRLQAWRTGGERCWRPRRLESRGGPTRARATGLATATSFQEACQWAPPRHGRKACRWAWRRGGGAGKRSSAAGGGCYGWAERGAANAHRSSAADDGATTGQ
eukprot:189661-Chlamydomonas_euryale.AAC.1